MPINVIENNMIVKNTIELQPDITYTVATEKCKDLPSLGLTEAGIFGQLDSKTFKLDYSGNSALKQRTRVIDQATDFNRVDREQSEILDYLHLNDLSDYKRITKEDKSGSFKFGIEKINQKYLVDDKNYYKKKSIKNLYRFYRENIEKRVLDPNWGISNYNTINFFSISEKLNNNFPSDSTHKNCLIYPNFKNAKEFAYDFTGEEYTFSFYINQRRKSKSKDLRFNPGCIISIPDMISIYIVKGSNQDINGLTESFRILVITGPNASKNISNLTSVTNSPSTLLAALNSTSSSTGPADEVGGTRKAVYYLSNDNIINFNSWHNIALTFKPKKYENSSKSNPTENLLNLSFYVDGVKVDSKDIYGFNYSQSNNSVVFIGNKPNIGNNDNNTEIEAIIKEAFSTNKLVNDDTIGPYVTKNISLGNHISSTEYFVHETSSGSSTDFVSSYGGSSKSYFESPASNALNAEIHDVRIYNKSFTNINNIICKKNITNFNDENLIFSIPVYYYDTPVKRKGIVNLNNSGIDLENFGQKISKSNILIQGIVNPYFANKCLGHEVNVENFLYEFKRKTSPNIVFGGILSENLTEDNFQLLFSSDNLTSSFDHINSHMQKGKSVNNLLHQRIQDIDFSTKLNYAEKIAENLFQYRNNLILPNDNGLQDQDYSNFTGYYESGYSGFVHINDNNIVDYEFLSLNNVHNDNIAYHPEVSLLSSCQIPNLVNLDSDIPGLVPLDQRDSLYFFVGLDRKSFRSYYDKFKNISLKNYYDTRFKIENNYDDNRFYWGNLSNELINVGFTEFFKDKSNPLGRKIDDSYDISIANHLSPIDEKVVDNTTDSPDTIGYFRHELPIFKLNNDYSETFSSIYCISTQLFRREIKRESLELYDSDLASTGGILKINLKDNGLGGVYRADCFTKHATWNNVGHCLYDEGIVTVLHPSLENFGVNSYRLKFKAQTRLNVFELNLPAHSGYTNLSRNSSYNEDLRLNNSAFNSDDNFVYITDINLHDENLNIVAKAKLAKPFAKKSLDNVVFRLKMDY